MLKVITATVTIKISAPNPMATNFNKLGSKARRPDAFLGALFIPKVKEKYPGKEVVWDMKVRFLYTNKPAIDLGADYVSVSDDASDDDIREHLEYGHAHNCKIIGDMITEKSGSNMLMRFEELGVDQISFHPNAHHDRYPVGDVLQLQIAKLVTTHTEISAYGGFTVDNMIPVLELKPDVIVIGAAIWEAEDPRKAAIEIRELMAKYK